MLKKFHENARIFFLLLLAVMVLATPVYAVINRIVGGNIIAGDGLSIGSNDPDTMHILVGWSHQLDNDTLKINVTQIWTDSLWEMIFNMVDSTDAVIDSAVGAERAATAVFADSADLVTHDHIYKWHFADGDWGDMSVSSNVISLDNDVVGTDEMADGDHGDFTYSGGSATLDANVVADNEIDYSAVTLDDFDYQTAWRVFYSNADGDVTELALGSDGTYLKSNGASAAPTWATPSGAGTQDTTWIWNDAGDEAHAGLNSAVHLKWGAGIDATWDADDTVVTVSVDRTELRYYDEWGGAQLAVDWAESDSFAIYFPLSEKTDGSYTHRYFLRIVNTSSTDDQSIPIHFSGILPGGFDNDCDTVTVGYRTNSTDTTVTKINLRIFAQYVTSGFAPEDTSKYAGNSFASGTASTWDWESIAGASISPIAGLSDIAYEARCYADAGDTIDIEIPRFCGQRK